MIDILINLDTQAFLFLNSINSPFFDKFMYFISYDKIFMGALLLLLIFLGFKKYHKKFPAIFFFCILSFGLSDSISSRIFKPGFKRLRPCHEKVLSDKVHLAGQKCWGGKYGFVSSHAANSFAIATFFWLLLKTQYSFMWLLFLHSGLVSYSRVYLAKHYPLDILAGAVLGIIVALFCFRLMKRFVLKINNNLAS